MSGQCPALSFTVGGRSVTTDKDTKFKGLKCEDIEAGMTVSIDGTADAGSAVNADTVQKADGHDN
jgi:hypothetical protein